MKLGIELVLGVAAAVVLATAGYAANRPALPALEGTGWTLSALNAQAPMPGAAITLAFEGGRASGSDGCNRYCTSYQESGGALRLTSQPAATLRACVEPVMRLGAGYLAALQKAEAYRMEGGRLILMGAGGTPIAVFDAQSNMLTGTARTATAYNTGAPAVASIAPGSQVTLAFGADGRLTGSAGCNTYVAPYGVSRSALETGPAATTRRACNDPPRVMEQEAQFLKALASAAAYQREGNTLEIRGARGAIAVMATLR